MVYRFKAIPLGSSSPDRYHYKELAQPNAHTHTHAHTRVLNQKRNHSQPSYSLGIQMAPVQTEKKPQPGDLIEIFRGIYQHWGIYVGDGFIIHLAPPCEHAQAGANSMMSVMHDKATVKKEQLCEVAGDNKYIVNNLHDEKYEPRPIDVILQEAHALLGNELPYCFLRGNCEHFVTELRYGKPESRQVRKAVEVAGMGVFAFFGVVLAAAAASYIGSRNKREDKNDK